MNTETIFYLQGEKVYLTSGTLHAGGKDVGTFRNNVYDFIGDRIDADCASWDFQWEIFKDLHTKAQAYYPGLEEENFLKHFGFTMQEASGKRILDAGAGTGRNSKMLNKHNAYVYAVDASKSIHHHAAQAPQALTWVRSNLSQLPFPDGYFDIILCDGVLPHVSDASKVLKEFRRILSAEGMFLSSYSEAPRTFFNSHNVVKLYRIITKHLGYATVLKFSRQLSSFYEVLKTRRIPKIVKDILLEFIPDKSTFDEWRICYIFDRLTARNWNFYPRSRFRKYLINSGFSIVRETDFRVSFVCRHNS